MGSEFSRSIITILCFSIFVVLVGCWDKPSFVPLSKEDAGSFSILYYDKQSFLEDFGEFNVYYPNTDVVVLETKHVFKGITSYEDYVKRFREYVEEVKPDVLFFDYYSDFVYYRDSDKLNSLDDIMAEDEYDIHRFVSVISNQLRGNKGLLYGVSLGFSSEVMYYNKAIFRDKNINMPTASWNWDDFSNIVRRFRNDDQIYGFYETGRSPSPFNMARRIALSRGLSYTSPQSDKLKFDSQQWRETLAMVVDLYQSDEVITFNSADMGTEDGWKNDPFLSGKAAMMAGNALMMYNVMQSADILERLGVLPEWGIVPLPLDPGADKCYQFIEPRKIFAIRSGSAQVPAAWQFIRHVTEDSTLANENLLSWDDIPSSLNVLEEKYAGIPYQAFYEYEPHTLGEDKWELWQTADMELKTVISQQTTLDEAIENLMKLDK